MFWNVQKWTKYNNILERTKIEQFQQCFEMYKIGPIQQCFGMYKNGPNTTILWNVQKLTKLSFGMYKMDQIQ